MQANVHLVDVEEIYQIGIFSNSPNRTQQELAPDCNYSSSTDEALYICHVNTDQLQAHNKLRNCIYANLEISMQAQYK